MPSSMQDVALAVKQLQWRHHRESDRRLSSQAGVSLVQWDVLRHLRRAPDSSLHDLATLTFQTDQSMGELARRMIDRGLIERIDGAGRAVRHQLTAAGIAAYEVGNSVFDGVLRETVGALSATERRQLHSLLVKAYSQ